MGSLIIENVMKKFKDQVIFEDVNMILEPGHIYGLVGENGSGKTLLMKMMIGLLSLSSGKIKYEGKEIGKDVEFLPEVGFLIENPGFLLEYTAQENLKMIAAIKGKANQQDILSAIQVVGLDPQLKAKVKAYSLGMKQRLGIAQAIMEQPKVLILDEPMNSLDYEGVALVRELIRSYKQSETIVVMTSHDERDIELLCDHVYRINKQEKSVRLER